MELKKIHEDDRGYIYLVKDLLDDNREFTFLEIKNGYARGGCLHSEDEYFIVLKGKIRYIHGNLEETVSMGESRTIPAGEPHAFVALEDSIVSEWGITTEEKERGGRDQEMRKMLDEINKKC